jgi:hypothetical protein
MGEVTLSDKVLIAVLILLNFYFYGEVYLTTRGVNIREDEAKRCASRWVVNALESSNFYLRISADSEGVSSMTNLKLKNKFAKLLPCITRVNIMNAPHPKSKALAYVMPQLSSNKMWVNSKEWPNISLEGKVHTIIHECTHLALGTNDYAYLGQEKYEGLRGYNASHNADTISQIISNINFLSC